MKVFISWSGETSRRVAEAFHDWLPYVLQPVKPFISTGDISKGRRWSDVLASELNDSAYGILIVTAQNFAKPWINFEAGAISKAVEKASVSPFLYNIEPERLHGPLAQFEATLNEKEDIRRLLCSINDRLPAEQQVLLPVLNHEFDLNWEDLRSKLDDAAKTEDPETETGFPWLYTADDVAHRQEGNETNAVWIVTPDPYRNVLKDGLKNALIRNMDRPVRYTFIVPTSEATNAACEQLERDAQGKPATIQVVRLSADSFREVAVTDYIILNPDTAPKAVFLELPSAERGFWMKADDEATDSLVVRFRKYVQSTAA